MICYDIDGEVLALCHDGDNYVIVRWEWEGVAFYSVGPHGQIKIGGPFYGPGRRRDSFRASPADKGSHLCVCHPCSMKIRGQFRVAGGKAKPIDVANNAEVPGTISLTETRVGGTYIVSRPLQYAYGHVLSVFLGDDLAKQYGHLTGSDSSIIVGRRFSFASPTVFDVSRFGNVRFAPYIAPDELTFGVIVRDSQGSFRVVIFDLD